MQYEEQTLRMAHDYDMRFFEFDILSRKNDLFLSSKQNITVSQDDCFDELYLEIEEIFNAIYIKKGNDFLRLPKWGHVDTEQFEHIWYNIYIKRDDLLMYGREYYNSRYLRNEEIDFMLVDMLLFSELIGLYEEIEKRSLPKYKYRQLRFNIQPKLWEKVNFIVYLFIFLILWLIFKPIALLFLLGVVIKTAFDIFILYKMKKMFIFTTQAYDSLRFKKWNVIWEDIQKARRDGVIFDKLAFDIVQRNL